MNGSIGDSSQNEKSNSVSSVLIVENLVRPFTLPGLKKILSKFGKIDDEKFWINKDKSKCYVVYEDNNIAVKSKEYINNLKWPASNLNTLNSEFGKLEILEELLKKQEEERIQLENEKKEAAALAAAKAEEERERRANLEEEALKSKNEENNCSGENLDLNDSSIREKTPPKQDVTNVVHVTNLVRPFKIAQLKDLLNKFGPIIEEKFWIDKIKSNCYAVYESNDIACQSRNYIHGLNWPSSNSKTLKADFAKLNDVNELLNSDVGKNIKEETKSNDENLNAKVDKQLIDENKDSKPLKNEIKQDEKDIVKEKSLAKNPVTNILFVKNLSRPFTMLQLKDLLSKDGEFNQEKFWIDKIKSKCYVTYENEEVAVKTRERIHDLTWPNGNQRQLQADFATESELEEILLQVKIAEESAKKQANESITKNDDKDKRNKIISENEKGQEKFDDNKHNQGVHQENSTRNSDQENDFNERRKRPRSISPRNKKDKNIKLSPRDTKNKERESQYDQKNNIQNDSPAKLLDDLFKKTVTVPSIYWMPLNEREIKLRDQKREDEKRRRMEFEKSRRYDSQPYFHNERRRSPFRRDRPYLDRQPLPPPRNYQYSERERFPNYEQEKRQFRPERSDRMRRRSPVRKSRSKSASHSVSRSRSSSSSSSSSFDSSKSRSVSKNKRVLSRSSSKKRSHRVYRK